MTGKRNGITPEFRDGRATCPNGHPFHSLVRADEGTTYCIECEAEARAIARIDARLRQLQRVTTDTGELAVLDLALDLVHAPARASKDHTTTPEATP
jgi:hypothetical protein